MHVIDELSAVHCCVSQNLGCTDRAMSVAFCDVVLRKDRKKVGLM
jgi:hypothetical protein